MVLGSDHLSVFNGFYMCKMQVCTDRNQRNDSNEPASSFNWYTFFSVVASPVQVT